MRLRIGLALVALALAASVVGAAEVKPGVIHATGQATVYVMPDKGQLQFAVSAEDKSLPTARQQAAATMETVLTSIRALKLEGLTLATKSVQVNPLYEAPKAGQQPVYGDDYARKIVSYRVVNTVAVTLKGDVEPLRKNLAAVIDTVLTSGAATLSGPYLSKEDTSATQLEALEKATRNAMANAQALAKGLGLPIARYTLASMNPPSAPQPMFAERAMMMAPGGGGTPTAIEIEAIPLEATVYVDAEF
ncbi:MAG TPA: SIMPL domain-containing protein [Armatimonadota bacterium]|jgi:uncharacterized protein YggE